MAPAGLLAKATGTDVAFAVARIVMACIGAAGVLLAGLLVRHRGPLATALACGILYAVNPGAILASHSVLLEPWLALFCLAGALAVFEGDNVTSGNRRLAIGGVAFGLAGAVKVWAVLPVLVVVAVCWRARGHRAALTYLGGVAGAFLVVVLPFAALDPRAFYNDVIVAQLSRVETARTSIPGRLGSLIGVSNVSSAATVAVLVGVAIASFVVVCAVAASLLTRRPPPALEAFAFGTTALIVLAFLWPPDYYPHYAGFLAPFLALAVALPAARLVDALAPPASWSALVRAGTAVAVLAIAAMAVDQAHYEASLRTVDPAAAGRPAHPTRLVCGHRHGLDDDRRRSFHLEPSALPAVHRLGRHRLRARPRAKRALGGRAQSGSQGHVARGAAPGPVRLA